MSTNKERESMIKVRGGYSDRNRLNPVCNIIQIDDLDERTLVILFNKICEEVDTNFYYYVDGSYEWSDEWSKFVKELLVEVFVEIVNPNDNLAKFPIFDKIKNVICKAPIHEVWDIIEFICNKLARIIYDKEVEIIQKYNVLFEEEPHKCEEPHRCGEQKVKDFFSEINAIFERECIGYRFVNGIIIQNTNDIEIAAIEEASTTEFDGCNAHIQKATSYLYDRKNPDYKNSIKESISAVESICCIITNEKNATLGDALKILGKNHQLHPCLKEGFEKLYAYTNQAGGIRHKNLEVESDVPFEEAKFMLISCCAFVNYLIEKYNKL